MNCVHRSSHYRFSGTLLMRLPGLTTEQENQLRNISVSANICFCHKRYPGPCKNESGNVELYPKAVSCQSVIKEITDTLAQAQSAKVSVWTVTCGRDMVIHKSYT